MSQSDSPTRSTSRRTMSMVATAKAAADNRLREGVQALQAQGHTVDVRVTWEGPDASAFAREAAQSGTYDTVIAAGGDGTVNCVVNGVMEAGADCAVGIVPLGTANDFATSCGLPLDPRQALQFIVEGTARTIDLGKLNDRVFVNIASGGYGTGATADAVQEEKDLLGAIAYAITGLREATNLQAHHANITGPDFVWEGDFYAIALGNGRQAGGGFQVCPRALLNDGLIDLMILPEMPFSQLLLLVRALRNGELADQGPIVYAQLPWLDLAVEQPVQVNLDGEPREETNMHVEALPDCVRVYVTAQAPLKHHA
jgi:lipid kinase YegS